MCARRKLTSPNRKSWSDFPASNKSPIQESDNATKTVRPYTLCIAPAVNETNTNALDAVILLTTDNVYRSKRLQKTIDTVAPATTATEINEFRSIFITVIYISLIDQLEFKKSPNCRSRPRIMRGVYYELIFCKDDEHCAHQNKTS